MEITPFRKSVSILSMQENCTPSNPDPPAWNLPCSFHPRILSFDNYDIARAVSSSHFKAKTVFPCALPKGYGFLLLSKRVPGYRKCILSERLLPFQRGTDCDRRPALPALYPGRAAEDPGDPGAGLLTTQEKTDDYRVEIIKNSLAYS